jgi:hypothetical protein
VIRAGTPEARAALAPGLPRKFTARASSDLEYIMIDSDLLDVLLTWDQTGQYEVTELNSDGLGVNGDWMTTCCRPRPSIAFRPRTSRRFSCACSASTIAAGDVVIKQGTEGDFFYVVVRANAWSLAKRRSTRKASSSPSSAPATASARRP